MPSGNTIFPSPPSLFAPPFSQPRSLFDCNGGGGKNWRPSYLLLFLPFRQPTNLASVIVVIVSFPLFWNASSCLFAIICLGGFNTISRPPPPFTDFMLGWGSEKTSLGSSSSCFSSFLQQNASSSFFFQSGKRVF